MSTYAIALIQLPIEIKEDMTVEHLTDRIEIHCIPCSLDKIPSKKPEFYVSNKMNQFVNQILSTKTKPVEDKNNVDDIGDINVNDTPFNPVIETKIDTIPSQVISRKDRSVTTFKNYKTKHVKNRTIRNLLL